MPTSSLAEIEQHRFDEVVERATWGEEIVVMRDGHAPFRLVPLGPEPNSSGPAGADPGVPEDDRVRAVMDGDAEESRGR